ncbi:hypothetical protein Metok_0459 [Methanothermococcus okinawensis IH1]|uniref:Uncharacterized protein n=1 Tax=Methanothermococcus okinawensis (strain DSM 14208 / JCM 11175 / IH1) TaxID=647113 RepID=F8AL06_METOI|nr:hypothetical protein Metok_0459 [Methanothermococcus okinawensis IH1]
MLSLMDYILLFAIFFIILGAFRNFINAYEQPKEKNIKIIKKRIFSLYIIPHVGKKTYFDCILWMNFVILIFSIALGIILIKYPINIKLLITPMFLISAVSIYTISMMFIIKHYYN